MGEKGYIDNKGRGIASSHKNTRTVSVVPAKNVPSISNNLVINISPSDNK